MTNVLAAILGALSIVASGAEATNRDSREVRYHDLDLTTPAGVKALHRRVDSAINAICARSEERRVGKECRSRWSPYH